MRNSAELRRFPSSHPSLFSGFFWIFWGQMRGGNEGEALYRRPDPVARGGGHPPVARRRGDRPPWRAHWPVAPGVGDRPLSPVGGGDRVPLPLISPGRHMRHPLCHLSLKIQEKREGWGEEKRRSSAELRTCDLPVTSVWIHWYCIAI